MANRYERVGYGNAIVPLHLFTMGWRLSRPPQGSRAREPLFVKDRGMLMTNSAPVPSLFSIPRPSPPPPASLGPRSTRGAVNLDRAAPFFSRIDGSIRR